MQFYPAGETIARQLLDLPLEQMEWIVTGADADKLITAGFQRHPLDETRFIHPGSGDLYQLARHQYLDKESGRLQYQCDQGVTLESELATRALTILAMAFDGDEIVDPFDGQDDLIDGVLRYVTPYYEYAAQNLLITAVWAARLKRWGFRITHGTFNRMRKMVASGAVRQLTQDEISDAVLQAMASPRPSELFRVLHRCGALRPISAEMDDLFEAVENSDSGQAVHDDVNGLPAVLASLDRAAAETDNVSTVLKRLHAALGENADHVFSSLGLGALFEHQHEED